MQSKMLMSVIVALTTVLSLSAYGQTPLTGTRINAAAASNSILSLQLEEPSEFNQIQGLLAQGKADAALKLALQYVERVESTGSDLTSRYFAHNALCVVYTSTRDDAKAEQECTRAVELMPGQWSALNNRGTARYLVGNMEGAKQDYLRALEQAGKKKERELVQHNLDLVDR